MSSMITITHKGDFSKTYKFLQKVHSKKFYKALEKYGQMGVDALRDATPKDTGKTADSWGYQINTTSDGASIVWTNSNQNRGVYIAVLIQYGHGTRNGGYVQGRDYINPAMRPVFDKIANEVWLEVISDE